MADLTTYVLLALYGSMLVLDVVAPARDLPPVRRWRLTGLVGFAAYVALAITLPMLWDAHLARFRLFDLTGLGLGWETLVGVLALELVQYGFHRAMHAVPLLWRSHQMHHSAERLDVFGAFFFHPIDVVLFTFSASLALVVGVGLSADAAALASAILTFLGFFQHANLKTPRWLGFLVHRPEQHGVHHGRGAHGGNYGSLAIFDQLFGTFENPATWEGPAGFYDGASARVGEMLLLRDVTRPRDVGERDHETRPSTSPRWA